MAPRVLKAKQKSRTKNLRANDAFLKLLCNTTTVQRKQLLRTATNNQVLSVCECVHNILKKNIPLSQQQFKKLRKCKAVLYKLANQKSSVAQRKRVLEQSGGFLPAIIAPIIGAILGAVADKVINR